jgi:hypothetical protein
MNWLKKLLGLGEETAKSAPSSSATLKKEPGNLYVIRISGTLNKATVDKIQSIGARDFDAGTEEMKTLVVLTDFQGWRRGDNWGDIDFLAQYGDRVSRMAVVGDMKWETETKMFLAAGHRKGEVRYFGTGQESQARAWLAS